MARLMRTLEKADFFFSWGERLVQWAQQPWVWVVVGVVTTYIFKIWAEVEGYPFIILTALALGSGAAAAILFAIFFTYVPPLLKKLTRSPLPIDIAIPGVYRMASGLFEAPDKDGWIVYLPNVRFTNRSRTERVSLGLTLKVNLKENPTKKDYLALQTDDMKPFQFSVPYLFSPINLGPQDTVTGNLGFLIWPHVEQAVCGSDAIDHNNSTLEIVDHISGKTMTIVASTFEWETPENAETPVRDKL